MARSLILAALALPAACAQPPAAGMPSGGRDSCFWASQVKGFGDAGPDRAIVRIGARERWELTLSPGCPDVDWAMKIGIRAHGGERICAGRPAELFVPDAGGTAQRCLVRQVRKLSPAESAAAAGETPRP